MGEIVGLFPPLPAAAERRPFVAGNNEQRTVKPSRRERVISATSAASTPVEYPVSSAGERLRRQQQQQQWPGRRIRRRRRGGGKDVGPEEARPTVTPLSVPTPRAEGLGQRQTRRAARRRIPKTAAVTLTCGEKVPSYADALRRAKEKVSLATQGILDKTQVRRAVTGGLIIEISGEGMG